MRHLSRSFVVGLLLAAASIVVTPLFTTALAGECSIPSPADPAAPSSWDCFQPVLYDFRVPALLGVSGIALMLVSVVRTSRAKRVD
jgi:hypothetical protein